jgi:hypothetical protein
MSSEDISRIFVIAALFVAALFLIYGHKRIMDASTLALPGTLPVDGGSIADDENSAPSWALNNPRVMPPPLSFMVPVTGTQPTNQSDAD